MVESTGVVARYVHAAWLKGPHPDPIKVPRPDGVTSQQTAKATLASDAGRAALASVGFPIHYAPDAAPDQGGDGQTKRHRPRMRDRDRPDGPYTPHRTEGGD